MPILLSRDGNGAGLACRAHSFRKPRALAAVLVDRALDLLQVHQPSLVGPRTKLSNVVVKGPLVRWNGRRGSVWRQGQSAGARWWRQFVGVVVRWKEAAAAVLE